ncbi:MAG: PadR family transcriptional regulator [Alteromonadaceae bacterium]|nr:PadR family transcriptional regulator [Alteromonadaceae bacterium]
MSEQEKLDKLKQELRRGALVLAVLLQLRHEHYGYSLRKALIDAGIEIEESTLYPLIRRLETQGLLDSEWREEAKRKKRFYRISDMGHTILQQLLKEWRSMNQSIEQISTTLD